MIDDRILDTYRTNDEINATDNSYDCDNYKKVDGDDSYDNDDGDDSSNYVGDLGENHRVMCVREIKYNNLSSSLISSELTLIVRDCFCYADEVGDNDSDLLLRCGCLIHYDCMVRYIKSQLGDKDMILSTYNKFKSSLLDKHYIICPYYNAGLCNANSMNKSFLSIDDLHHIRSLFNDNNDYKNNDNNKNNDDDNNNNNNNNRSTIEDDCPTNTQFSDFTSYLCIHESDIDKLIEWICEYNTKILAYDDSSADITKGNKAMTIPLIDPSDYENDAYIEATTKKCPHCNVRGTHYHGHMCHHISPMGGCSNCHTHYCYRCLSTEQDNLMIRRNRSSCLCGHWSSFCSPLTDRSDVKKYLVKAPYPYDKRCGCVICPDCSLNRPCSTCPGDCVVCLVNVMMLMILMIMMMMIMILMMLMILIILMMIMMIMILMMVLILMIMILMLMILMMIMMMMIIAIAMMIDDDDDYGRYDIILVCDRIVSTSTLVTDLCPYLFRVICPLALKNSPNQPSHYSHGKCHS
jgi:hypothetical protein